MLFSIFGPSKANAWKEVALQLGKNARFEKVDFWSNLKLFYTHQNWEFLLKTRTSRSNNHSATFTTLKVPFAASSDFRFRITQEGIFSAVGKYLNFNDIETNDKKFDNEFYIKGNDETLVKRMLIDDSIRKIMLSLKEMDLEVTADTGSWGTDLPHRVLILKYECLGVIKDVNTIEKILILLSKILDRLLEMGVILKYHPNFKLS
jgi:hypothetical protein